MKVSKEQIYDFLREVEDPEIPSINIVEMGIVRGIEISPSKIEVAITPTYSGCPAMKMIEDEVCRCLQGKGLQDVKIKTVFSPPWTSDWITVEAREKLKKEGISPPEKKSLSQNQFPFSQEAKNPNCPYCNSANTEKKSEFGSTPCKSMHYCHGCIQPFEHFKCI